LELPITTTFFMVPPFSLLFSDRNSAFYDKEYPLKKAKVKSVHTIFHEFPF